MQRILSGSFRLDRLRSGLWRVRNTRSPHEIALLRNLRATEQNFPADELPEEFDALRLEWNSPDSVAVVLGAAGRLLEADSVVLHEPNERLYDGLALARFTPDARRFWQRIFWLVRLPGGRALLRLVARGRRA